MSDKIVLRAYPDGEPVRIQIGEIHLSAILRNGKTCISLTALNGGDFLQIQPSTGNSINVIADKDFRIYPIYK